MKEDQLSKTAAFVAIKFYGLTREERFRSLFEPSVVNFYEKIVHSLPAPLSYYHFWLQFKCIRKCYLWAEELLLPGDLLHILARKRYNQMVIDQMIEQGYEQLIVLGSGLDHLGYHCSQKNLHCYEVDVPQMATYKQHFLQNYYPNETHPDIIASHFSDYQPLTKITNHPKIDADRKTIVVAEGFFDYLNPNMVSHILGQFHTHFSNNLRLVSTHFALDELPILHRRVFKSSVRMVGEKLRFDVSIDVFKQILLEHGYRISRFYDTQTISEDIQSHIKTTLPLLKGFYIISAES